MGALRLFITLVIVIGHIKTYYQMQIPLLGVIHSGGLSGISKVHVYFLQSGFLTQLAFLATGFMPDQATRYYWKRIKRIYPQYILFTVLTLVVAMVYSDARYLELMSKEDISPYEAVLSNILGLNFQTLNLFNLDYMAGSRHMLLTQSWTLTFQAGFILLAPFMLTSGRRLLIVTLLCAASLLYACFMMKIARNVFATELIYFWVGAYVARFSLWLAKFANRQNMTMLGVVTIVPVVILSIFYLPVEGIMGKWMVFFAYNVLLACAMIPAYYFSHGSAWDRLCSAMAYTVFLCHLIVAFLVYKLFPNQQWQGTVTVIISLAIAFALNVISSRLHPKGTVKKGMHGADS